jgi:hypothetical protein
MCIQSNLTKTEITKYLAPNKPYAEEQFIQQKINESINSTEIDLHVMFVPNAFYELFCIQEQSYNAFYKKFEKAQNMGNMHALPFHMPAEKPLDSLSYQKTEAVNMLKNAFTEFNELFFKSDHQISDLSLINNSLVRYIFNAYPELCHAKSIIDASNQLQPKLEELKANICKSLAENDDYKKTVTRNLIPTDSSKYFKEESETHIISTVMALEYEARSLNKKLILRGTDILEQQNLFKHIAEEKIILAGSTIRETRSFKHSLLTTDNEPYSISYANSLFAGFYQDPGGCAYNYLNGRKSKLSDPEVIGYGLLIDQQEYLKNHNHELFYIPSLSPLTSLFERGQYCHPRSRTAVLDKSKTKQVEGLVRANKQGLIDPADIIVFEGDPIKHEEKFSAFLAKNGRLIQIKNKSSNSINENIAKKIMTSQKIVAQAHQQIRVLGKKMLRRLLRAGSDPIPEFSELELYKILEEGATKEQYIRLQKSLSSLQLAPITSKFFQMSNNDLHSTILMQRHDALLKETLQISSNLLDTEISEKIELWDKNPIFVQNNIVQIVEIFDTWMQASQGQKTYGASRIISSGITNKLIGTDSVNQIFSIIESWIKSPHTKIQQSGLNIFTKIWTTIQLNPEQINHAIHQVIQWGTSSNFELQNVFMSIIYDVLPIDDKTMRQQNLTHKDLELLLPVLLNNEIMKKSMSNNIFLQFDMFLGLITSSLLNDTTIDLLLHWMSNQEKISYNIKDFRLFSADIFGYLVKKYKLSNHAIDHIMQFIYQDMNTRNNSAFLRNLKIIELLLKKSNTIEPHNVDQIKEWVNRGISEKQHFFEQNGEILHSAIFNIIQSLTQQKLIGSEYLDTLLTKHAEFWSETEKTELHKNIEHLKLQEISEQEEFIKNTISTKSNSKTQSMLDFALHGSGPMRKTNINLMRLNPETNQSEFVPPSSRELAAQRKQMQQFNAQREQQAFEQAAQLAERHKVLELQQQAYEKTQQLKAAELIPSLSVNKARLGRTLPKLIR